MNNNELKRCKRGTNCRRCVVGGGCEGQLSCRVSIASLCVIALLVTATSSTCPEDLCTTRAYYCSICPGGWYPDTGTPDPTIPYCQCPQGVQMVYCKYCPPYTTSWFGAAPFCGDNYNCPTQYKCMQTNTCGNGECCWTGNKIQCALFTNQ